MEAVSALDKATARMETNSNAATVSPPGDGDSDALGRGKNIRSEGGKEVEKSDEKIFAGCKISRRDCIFFEITGGATIKRDAVNNYRDAAVC